jgi:hypothetical protein
MHFESKSVSLVAAASSSVPARWARTAAALLPARRPVSGRASLALLGELAAGVVDDSAGVVGRESSDQDRCLWVA